MRTAQPANPLLAQFITALPDPAFYLEALRDEQQQLIDLVFTHGNPAGNTVARSLIQANQGERLLGDDPERRERMEPLFRQYAVLLRSDETRMMHDLILVDGQPARLSRSRLGDGMLVIVRALDEPPGVTDIKQSQQTQMQQALQIEQQAHFLNSILDASSNGIVAERAIRDTDGVITDFLIVSANQQAALIVNSTVEELVGHGDLELHPELRTSGIFDAYVRTIETGEPQFIETHYHDGRLDHWVNINTRKLSDDELVITFQNVSEMKRTQHASAQVADENKRQAELLNSVLDGSNSGIIAFEAIRDDAGTIVDFYFVTANRACEQLLGIPLDTMLGNKLLTLFPGNVETGLFALYVNTTQTGEPSRTEVYYNHDGLDFWLDISAQKLGDGFVVTFTDTSVVKRAAKAVEQAAAASERQTELLNTVLNNSQTAISLHEAIRDATGQIVDFRAVLANNRAMAMWGTQADAVMTRTLREVTTPDQQTSDFSKYVNVVETGEPDLTEFNIGEQWLLRLTAKAGDGVVISNIDITQNHQLQQRLEASAAELQTVIDTSQTGIFLFSPIRSETGEVVDFRFRVANRQLAAYVGQQPEAVIGALGSTWFPDYKTNGLFDAYRKTYETGEQLRFDFHYDGGGIDVWLDIMSTKIGDEVLVTFGDYTPLKQLQQQLENSVVDLQRSNKNLEQFAYIASHDLQEPLRKIQAFGDLLQSQYQPHMGEEGADIIRRMQAAAARMQALIKDVLAYSRIATKRETVRAVDLNQVVKDVLGNLETAIDDKRALVTVEPLPTLRGDAAQLRQLFQNLISNALKFTKSDPTAEPPKINLTTRPLRGRDLTPVEEHPDSGRSVGISLSANDADRLFQLIEIADNGIGFDPHQAERIFQVFQRLHSRSEYQGTGIGLAIVQKVIENHQGYIVAEGRPGQGATFRILLPL